MDLVGYFRDIGRAAFKNDDPVKAGFDRNGSLLVAEAQGKYAAAARSGNLFHAAAPVLTIPATAGSLASVFTLVNPVGSPKTVELIEVDIAIILATTVVDGVALYEQSVAAAISCRPPSPPARRPTPSSAPAASRRPSSAPRRPISAR
jgi:hypothetical protein